MVPGDNNHQNRHHTSHEECNIKVWNVRVETSDQTPRSCHDQIRSIMNLPSKAPPSASQKFASMFRSDVRWIVKCTPWQLRKRFAINIRPLLHHSEAVFLRVSRVPNIVRRQ